MVGPTASLRATLKIGEEEGLLNSEAPLPTGTPEAVGLDLSYLDGVSRHLSEEIDHKLHSKGRWGAEQIVPVWWIERSTRPWTRVRGEPYGYLWWRNTLRYGDGAVEVISARGNGGQAILVVPKYDLVAVFTAGYYNSDET